MKLKTNNDIITYYMKAGNDWVQAEMPIEKAEQIIANSKNVTDSNERCGVCEKCVDDKFYFPYEPPKSGKSKEPKTE